MHPPIPVRFEPLFKPKPWGGRALERLFGKPLPPGVAIGESWELSGLPGNQTRVRGGPLSGATLGALTELWGPGLCGPQLPSGGEFPLLIKFLDAAEHLSVQVHPRPSPTGVVAGLKHEAWYVISSDPGAEIFIGLKPGVTALELAGAASSPGIEKLLQARRVSPGDCFYLPSGIVHALGAGVVVAEVQTPSDVTYRLYDWGRTDAAGRARELHIEQALENALLHVPEDRIIQYRPGDPAASSRPRQRLVTCERFLLDRLELPPGTGCLPPHPGGLRVWIAVAGQGELSREGYRLPFVPGDVLLIPAAAPGPELATVGSTVLEVTLPADAFAEVPGS